MIIVAGYVHVDFIDRDRYIEAFTDMVNRARNAPGCLDFSLSNDSVDPSRINIFEQWDSQENLDHFRANANPPDPGIETRDASMQEYIIDRSREPFSTD